MTVAQREASPAVEPLVEREAALAALRHALDEAKSGNGRMVVVRGEAGIGKSSLVRNFLGGRRPGIRVALGVCDGVETPRPFAPLEDMIPALGRELGRLLDDAVSYGPIARWVRDRLAQAGPWIFVIEDIQWADEATLGVLLFLARRLDGLPSLLIVTCRDDEALPPIVERTLGQLASVPGVLQLPLASLSRQGIAALAAGTGFDVDELAEWTAGNPLFVHEILRSGNERVPVSIRDAIRSRVAALDGRAQRALQAAAVAGPHPEPWLVAALAGEDVLGVDACVREGLLVNGETIGFAHELTRMVVLDDMPLFRAIALHRHALATLRRAGSTDSARLAHHAEAAADASAVIEYATSAGRKAETLGALREAVAQYRRALRFGGQLQPAQRAELLERLAHVLYLRNELTEAYALGREAVELRRGGDTHALGSSLTAQSLLAWLIERGDEAKALAREAVRLLEPIGDSHELGLAYQRVGGLAFGAGVFDEAKTWCRRALEVADRLGDPEVRAGALLTLGTMGMVQGDPAGVFQLEETLRLGREMEFGAVVVDSALNNLGACSTAAREFRAAETYLVALEDHGERSEIVRCSIDEPRAEIALALGEWAAAERHAQAASYARDPIDRALATVVLARLDIRRGGRRSEELLAGARELSTRLNSTFLRWPLNSWEAEQAWLAGTLERLEPALRETYEEACGQGDPWAIGEFGRRLWLISALAEVDPRAALPYRLEIEGDRAGAVAEWERREMPYEAACCQAASDDPVELRRAHATFVRLGATAAAERVRASIRALGGVVPRGPRQTTRANPDGLTAREAEVAALVAQGLSNDEIAGRLVCSTRTVAHHVSAILGKLNIERRTQVALAMVSPAHPVPGPGQLGGADGAPAAQV